MAIKETKALLELSKIKNSTTDWGANAPMAREISLDFYERCKSENFRLEDFTDHPPPPQKL